MLFLGRFLNAAVHSTVDPPFTQMSCLLLVNCGLLLALARWHSLFRERKSVAIVLALYMCRVLVCCFLLIEITENQDVIETELI